MPRRLVFGLVALLAASAAASAQEVDPWTGALLSPPARAAAEANDQVLAKAGVKTDAELLDYLKQLKVAPNSIASLVAQLGDSNWKRREMATHLLMGLVDEARDALKEALSSPDAEVRSRAKEILDAPAPPPVFEAVVERLVQRKVAGSVAVLLEVLPSLPPRRASLAQAAALALASPADRDVLRKELASGNERERVLAIRAYAKALAAEAIPELSRLAEGADDRAALTAIRQLLALGDTKCLSALGRRLDSADLNVRAQSATLVEAIADDDFGYAAYDDPAVRKAAAQKAQKWLAEAKPEAIHRPRGLDSEPSGRMLVCVGCGDRVVEYDSDGEVTWQVAISDPWGCARLPDGRRLVVSWSGRLLVEYDKNGCEVSRRASLPAGPMSVQELAGGRKLLACREGGEVLELGADGKFGWEVRLEGGPSDARRLRNGRTLVALQRGNEVIELDGKGTVRWRAKISSPTSACRLPNGRTLVSSYLDGKVVELDSEGRVVWSAGGFEKTNCAVRLPNGNTLVSCVGGVREIDRQGKVVRETKLASSGIHWD